MSARWLASNDALDREAASVMLLDLLRGADDQQLVPIIVDDEVGARARDMLWAKAPEVMLRPLEGEALPLRLFVQLAARMLVMLSSDAKVKLAKHILSRFLGQRFGDKKISFLARVLSTIGNQLDGALAARMGLSKNVDGAVASRNMLVFRKATQPARLWVVWSIAEVAQVLRDRRSFFASPKPNTSRPCSRMRAASRVPLANTRLHDCPCAVQGRADH